MIRNIIQLLGIVAVLVAGMMLGAYVNPADAGTYTSAKRYIGLHERKHAGTLRKVVGVNPRRTPWCGFFVGAMVKKNGMKPVAGYGRAAAWKKWGYGVRNPRKGDVVVIRTRRGHHVGFYAGSSKGRVHLLGGNQSNQVKVSSYRARSVVAIRRGSGKKYAMKSVFQRSEPRKIRRVSMKNTRFGRFLKKIRRKI